MEHLVADPYAVDSNGAHGCYGRTPDVKLVSDAASLKEKTPKACCLSYRTRCPEAGCHAGKTWALAQVLAAVICYYFHQRIQVNGLGYVVVGKGGFTVVMGVACGFN